MDTIPEGLDIPQDGSGDHQPSGVLAEARVKLAAALRAFSVAQAAVPGLQAALAAGYPLPRDDLVELDRVRSAMADAAHALGLDPDRATLAEMEARLSTWERAVALRRALGRLTQATRPGVAAAALAAVAAHAAPPPPAASWAPD